MPSIDRIISDRLHFRTYVQRCSAGVSYLLSEICSKALTNWNRNLDTLHNILRMFTLTSYVTEIWRSQLVRVCKDHITRLLKLQYCFQIWSRPSLYLLSSQWPPKRLRLNSYHGYKRRTFDARCPIYLGCQLYQKYLKDKIEPQYLTWSCF